MKKKIKRYKLGGEDISTIIDSSLDLVTQNIGRSNAVTGGDAAMQSVQGVLSGAASGASLGTTIMPGIGTAIGAIGGAVIGSIGKKGSVEQGGFYEDPTLNLGTGLVGAFSNKGLREEYRELQDTARSHRAALANTVSAQQKWNEKYDPYVYTAAYGGQIPSSLAYVDDGETINTPNGNIVEVPEKHQPVDSNLVDLPEGSRILSNTLKVPGTKKTYAKAYKEMSSKKISKGKDIFAENSRKLNQMNDQMLHDHLFNLQELQKQGKKEYKKGLEKFQWGGRSTGKVKWEYGNPYEVKEGYGTTFMKQMPNIKNIPDLSDKDLSKGWEYQQYTPEEYVPSGIKYDKYTFFPKQKEQKRAKYVGATNFHAEFTAGNTTYSYNDNAKTYKAIVNKKPNVTDNTFTESELDKMQFNDSTPVNATTSASTSAKTVSKPKARKVEAPDMSSAIGTEIIGDASIMPNTVLPSIARKTTVPTTITSPVEPKYNTSNTPNNKNIGDIIGNIASGISNTLGKLSPVISNLMAKPERFDTVYNPYTMQIADVMGKRRYDINPALEQIRQNQAITNYNMDQLSPTTGSGMAYRLQNAVNTNRAISDLYSQKNNIDNQYIGDYANTLNNLGQQYVQAKNLSTDLNARSRAAARNINRAGYSQFSNYLQNEELMRNLYNRDMATLSLYDPFLESVFKTSDYNNFKKYIK